MISFLFFLCLSLIMPCSSLAQNPYPSEVTICYGPWKPYEYEENGRTQGVNVEITEATAKTLGIHIIWKSYPWSRCVENAKQGLVDGLMSLYHSKERETFFFFPSENVNIDQSVFITYPDSGIIFNGSLKSLTGEKVIIAQSNSYGQEFDEADNFTKIMVPTQANVILMVSARRHRIGIGSRDYIESFIEKNRLSNIVFLEPPYLIKTYFAFSRKKGQIYQKLSDDMAKALKGFKKKQAYVEIQKKYDFPIR